MADDTQEETHTIIDKYDYPETSSQEHWHSPSTGGELVWNNQQWAIRMNALIKEYNKTISDTLVDVDSEKDHIPYIAVPAAPTRGYNIHHHSSQFDGGLIFGAGMHDHRSNAHGGFAYAVYAAATSVPVKAYEVEEVN